MNEELELRDVCIESEGRLNIIIIIIIVTLVTMTSDLNIRVKNPPAPASWPPTPRLVGLEASTKLQSSSSTLSGEKKITRRSYLRLRHYYLL